MSATWECCQILNQKAGKPLETELRKAAPASELQVGQWEPHTVRLFRSLHTFEIIEHG